MPTPRPTIAPFFPPTPSAFPPWNVETPEPSAAPSASPTRTAQPTETGREERFEQIIDSLQAAGVGGGDDSIFIQQFGQPPSPQLQSIRWLFDEDENDYLGTNKNTPAY